MRAIESVSAQCRPGICIAPGPLERADDPVHARLVGTMRFRPALLVIAAEAIAYEPQALVVAGEPGCLRHAPASASIETMFGAWGSSGTTIGVPVTGSAMTTHGSPKTSFTSSSVMMSFGGPAAITAPSCITIT